MFVSIDGIPRVALEVMLPSFCEISAGNRRGGQTGSRFRCTTPGKNAVQRRKRSEVIEGVNYEKQ